MKLKEFYKKEIKGKIRRWHVELIILGMIIAPMMWMIVWIQEQSAAVFDSDGIRRALLGIASGVIGLGIWVLGASVIIINILKEMLSELQKISKK